MLSQSASQSHLIISVFCLSLCFSLHILDPVSFSSHVYSLILVDHILHSFLRMDTWKVGFFFFFFFRTPVFENVFILLLLLIKIWLDLYIQFSSVAQSCPTLCDPMNCSTPGLPVHHQLPEFTQTHV